ncbi:hypothetical protein LZC95_04225 [Pendulispora brunnea]|uniref:Uncharacterized protein n=1 Tax=Pendulispora brunnea TaxID=2905690 RepID=A0ABZ2KBK0_9BACT
MRIAFASFLACVLLVLSSAVHAGGRPMVLVASEHADVRMARAESELVAAGLAARRYLAPVGEKLGPDALREQADASEVVAVLAIVDAGIEVWLRSKHDHGLVFVELVREKAGDLVAVRAVEIVRAAVLDDARPLPEKAPPATAPPPKPKTAPPSLPHLTAFAGFGGLASPGVGVGWGLDLAAAIHADHHFGFELDVHAPVIPAEVTRPEGSARVRVTMLGGSIVYTALSPEYRARPHVRVGLSAAFLSGEGSAFPPFFGNAGMLVAPFAWAGVGTGVRVSHRVHVRGDIAVGTTMSTMQLSFAGRGHATWGEPALFASLGIEFHFGEER